MSQLPRSRANFDDAEDLPDAKDELTEEQITKLIYQKPKVRKNYQRAFQSRGAIRKEFFHLIFERLPNGELRHPVEILASNVVRWEDALRRFEDPGKRASPKTNVQHENGESDAEDEPVVPSSLISTGWTAPARTTTPFARNDAHHCESPIRQPGNGNLDPRLRGYPSAAWDLFPPVQGQAQFASYPAVQGIASTAASESIAHTVASGRQEFPPVHGRAQFASPPAIQSIEHTATSGREPYDQRTTEDRPNNPTDWGMQSPAGAFMAATVLEKSPAQQNLRPDIGRSIPKINLSLMDAGDLPEFTQWIHGQVLKLNLSVLEAPAGTSPQYKLRATDMMVNLLNVSKSCYKFEEQLRKAQAREQ